VPCQPMCGGGGHVVPCSLSHSPTHGHRLVHGMLNNTLSNKRNFNGSFLGKGMPLSGVDRREHHIHKSLPQDQEDVLPIFPLGIVALPASQCPLHIFEARYRVLFSTLIANEAEGIDQGLVSPDKPWKGTRRFGMAYYDQQAGGLASVGTVLEIQEHSTMDDGRMLIENIGRERFKIVDVVEEKPVLVCKVEYLPDDEESESLPVLQDLREDVAGLFKDVVRLSTKIKEIPGADADALEPKELETLGPRDLSFWVASLFAGSPYNQQALLEENSTEKRLSVEKELLENTLKYLSAQAALQSLDFSSGSGDSGL
jgi:Lon protease-like protein